VQPISTVEEFEHIILYQTAQQLVPFLLKLAKEHVVAVRENLKKLWRELDRRDESNNWQAAITTEQEDMLQLAAIATFTPAQVLRPPMRFWFAHRYEPRPEFWTVIAHAQPVWLADLLLPAARSADTWGVPYYSFVRKLEQQQLLKFEPELFAKTIHNWLPELGDSLSTREAIPLDANEAVTQLLADNQQVLNRDLLLIFEFDTHIEKAQCRIQKRPAITENWNGRWQEWNQLHPPQGMNWQEAFVRLTASGHLDRADILTRCLLALRRDFRRPLLTWFRELFLALKPTFTERLARQDELTELLAHSQALVVNFALDQLKDMHTEPGFNLAPFLLSADSLLTRPDLKTGLRTLVAGLAKLPYRTPAHAPAVASLLTSALAHPDAAVQERAAKGLAGLLSAKKPLLTAAETAVTLAALAQQAELLGAAARTALAPWLAAPRVAAATEQATYAPLMHFVPDISPATAIAPVTDWHDLLFLTGQVLKHDDPAALERWLDGLLRLHKQLPAGHTLALRPYLQQHWPQIKGQSEAAQVAILEAIEPTTGHRGLMQALLLSWVREFKTPLVPTVHLHDAYHTADPLVAVAQQRLAFAEELLRTRTALPLLSTPSHAPCWVAPTVLVQRLLAYEAAAHVPHPSDLVVALARLAHAHADEAAAALALLPQLRHLGLRTLLGWLLGPDDEALPARVASLVAAPQPVSPLPTAVEEALPALWAVAARTKQPAGTFPELASLTPGTIPGAAWPWQPNWEAVPLTRTYNDTWLAGNPEVTEHWTELRIALPTTTDAVSPLLLYALHATVPDRLGYEWTRYSYWLTADYPFLASLLPNSLAALHWHTLRVAAYTPSDLISAALTSLYAGPGPRFDEAATLLLALGLTHETDYCRALAVEVMLAAITVSRLVPTALGTFVGRLLAANFVLAKPFATSMRQAQAVSPVVDAVLAHVLAALVPQLPATPPRHTRKLLEVYADLLARTHRPLPPAVRPNLLAWQKTANLKAVAKALLTRPEPVYHLA
jgi:hypothetical protein